MPELMPSFGGPEQVVTIAVSSTEADRLDALGEQRAHQRLGVVSTEAHRAQGGGDFVVGESAPPGSASTSALPGAVTTASPASR